MDNDDIHKLFNNINSDFTLLKPELISEKMYSTVLKMIVDYVVIMDEVIKSDSENNYMYVKQLNSKQIDAILMFHKNVIQILEKTERYEFCIMVQKINQILHTYKTAEKNTSNNS